jgi:hypothetical protein
MCREAITTGSCAFLDIAGMPPHQKQFFPASSHSVPVNQNPKAEQGSDGYETKIILLLRTDWGLICYP